MLETIFRLTRTRFGVKWSEVLNEVASLYCVAFLSKVSDVYLYDYY